MNVQYLKEHWEKLLPIKGVYPIFKGILAGQSREAIDKQVKLLQESNVTMPRGVDLKDLLDFSFTNINTLKGLFNEKLSPVEVLIKETMQEMEEEKIEERKKKKKEEKEDHHGPREKPIVKRVNKAIKNEVIGRHSNGRTNDEYRELRGFSEKEIFNKWYKEQTALGKTPTEQETEEYKKGTEFNKNVQELADRAYTKSHNDEIQSLVEIEKTRVYEVHSFDPAANELKKTLREAGELGGEDGDKLKRQYLEDFHNEFSHKSIAYSEDIPELGEYLSEAPRVQILVPSSTSHGEETRKYSGGSSSGDDGGIASFPQDNEQNDRQQSQGGSNRPNLRSLGAKETEEEAAKRAEREAEKKAAKAAAKAERRAVKKAGKSGAKKIGQKIVSQIGQKAIIGLLGAISWEVWAVIIGIILLLLLILFLLTSVFDDQTGQNLVSITKSVDKEAVGNPPADAGYTKALFTPQDITYTLNVSYSGQAQSITVTDPIPENAVFVSADSNAELTKDGNGNVTSVNWTVTPSATTATTASSSVSNVGVETTQTTSTFINPNNSNCIGLGDWLNKKLSGSGLANQGAAMASLSSKYNIPWELALGMFWHEAQWATTGINPKANNPGDLSNGTRTTGTPACAKWSSTPNKVTSVSTSMNTYCAYPSMEDGIEAYLKLLNSNYRSQVDDFIQTSDPSKVIAKYYSSSNDESGGSASQYIKNINTKVQELRAAAKTDNTCDVPSFSGVGANSSIIFKLIVRPKQDVKNVYIINQATANSTDGAGNTGGTGPTGPSVSNPKNTAEWINIFKNASILSQVPWEFLASVAIQESGLGSDFGTCSYYPVAPGGHVLVLGNGLRRKSNDATSFAGICLKINKPLNTGVSCNPAGSCCGGAMGYTQIMPDELVDLGPKVEQMLGHYPDPWNAMDAAVLTGIILKNKVGIGVNAPMPEVYNTMFDAAWRYYGKTASGIFYPNKVMARYKEIKSTQTLPK